MFMIELPVDVVDRYERLREMYGCSDVEMFERMLKGVSPLWVNRVVMTDVWWRLKFDESGSGRERVDDVVKREFEWLLVEKADMLDARTVMQLEGTLFWLSVVRWVHDYTDLCYKAVAAEVGMRIERNWDDNLRILGYAGLEWASPESNKKGVVDMKYGHGDVLYQSQLAVERVRARQCKLLGINYAVVVSGYQFPAKEETLRKLEESVGRIYTLERYAGLSEIFG